MHTCSSHLPPQPTNKCGIGGGRGKGGRGKRGGERERERRHHHLLDKKDLITMTKDLNVRSKTTQFSEENRRETS